MTSEVLSYRNNKNVSDDVLYDMHAMELFIFDASILRYWIPTWSKVTLIPNK